MLGPAGRNRSGDLKLLNIECAMAEGAYILHFRSAELQHVGPGTGLDGHQEPAETGSAAVSLVPKREVENAAGEQEPNARERRVSQIETKLVAVQVEEGRVGRPEKVQEPEDACGTQGGAGQFEQQEPPVQGVSLHVLRDVLPGWLHL